MSNWDEIKETDIDETEEIFDDTSFDENDEESTKDSKFSKILNSNSKFKLSGMFKDWFLDYSSYVILQRAVPHIIDGLKPVQRRVLTAMYKMDDGNYTKVANIVGQAMQYHPHGDQSILGALVQIGQKGYAVDCQGNWGNILTGDSNAAPRYIEARLSKFAKEVIFDPKITNWMTSYDGRNKEPIELPVRFPLLLAQGTEGIAVGMASKILPHNFNELIDASIAILKNKDFEIFPDFPTGGYVDCSKYLDGKRGGSVKVRAKIDKVDKNTLVITELPYGKTTNALIDSILKAKEKGKIRIKKIEDMTTEKVEILIHLPNDVSPDKTIDALYACSDCEINLNPNACVIKDNKPQFLSVKDILIYDTEHTKSLLGQQLEIRLAELERDWHYSSLEKIFFENRIYKILEQNQNSWELQLQEVFSKMKEYEQSLKKEIIMEDIHKLVEKPVRKISKFDTKEIDSKITELEKSIKEVQNNLAHLNNYTIDWFSSLKKKYGKDFPRKSELSSFETIRATKVVNKNEKLYANLKAGFVGINLKKDDEGEYICDCSDISEIIVINNEGKYLITKVSEKAFFWENLIYVGLFNRGDNRTTYNVIYQDGKTSISYAKRFNITSLTRDKEYNITQGKEGSRILWFTVNKNGEAETVRICLRPKAKMKKPEFEWDFSELAIKGKASRGNLVSKYTIHKIELRAKGISTIGGKDIWYDADVQRLNEDKRGLFLGEFEGDDKILAVFKDGTYYTSSYDLSNRYQGEVLKIEKLDINKTYTAIYFDGKSKSFYVKRFSFSPSNNNAQIFISEHKNSYLVALNDDKHPRFEISFTGKHEYRENEIVVAEDFIAKKGINAKGKRCSTYEIKDIRFIEALTIQEDNIEDEIDIVEQDINQEDNSDIKETLF